MSRVIGYYLSVNGHIRYSTKLMTKAKAIGDAIEAIMSPESKSKPKKIGVVRANDLVLIMTVIPNEKKGYTIDKK